MRLKGQIIQRQLELIFDIMQSTIQYQRGHTRLHEAKFNLTKNKQERSCKNLECREYYCHLKIHVERLLNCFAIMVLN